MALAKNQSQTDKVSTEKERLIDNHKKMKRYGHLFENIVKIENIEKAIDKASDACAMISYDGLIKKSNCYKYLTKYIYPYVSVNRCRKVVSNENRKQHPSNKKI